MWNKNERDGKFEELKGKTKQVAGKVTNNPELVEEGQVDEIAGKTQGTLGKVTRKVGEAVDDVKDAVKKD
jgi:uncharacterized protein YjbJ (UPF0337 family)